MKTLKNVFNEFNLTRAIFLSLLVHLMLLVNVSGLFKKSVPPPPELQITFQKLDNQLSDPAPKAADVPNPSKEIPKPLIKKIKPLPEKASEIPVSQTQKSMPEPSSQSDQKKEEAPIIKPNTDFKNAGEVALNDFSNLLARHIAKFKMYPKIAQMRGWQGEVVLELQLSQDGQLTSSKVIRSSGFDVLDSESLEMVKRASPFPVPPEILKNRSFNILVPIRFKLD